MSTENNQVEISPTDTSELLLQQLRFLQNSSILDRGEAAMRLAETTVIHLRDLEHRISTLESKK